MRKCIYKYKIDDERIEIDLPKGAEILCVQTQNEVPHIWALVDPSIEVKEKRWFRVIGTGEDLDCFSSLKYIGTFQFMKGLLVWHVFEERI